MIVLNTLNLAVTEYGWQFQSITPTHAGDATGLFEFGGDLDDEALIVGTIRTPKTLIGESTKCRVEMVYFALDAEDTGTLTVHGENDSWEYDFPIRDSGMSRAQPGKGIRENYLAFGFKKYDGKSFILDRIEAVEVSSKTRRVA